MTLLSSLKKLKSQSFCFGFDLDDTLIYEKEYVFSGFNEIDLFLNKNDIQGKHFEYLIQSFEIGDKNPIKKLAEMVSFYDYKILVEVLRNHKPKITPIYGTLRFLQILASLKIQTFVISNGRSTTQRNKLKSSGLYQYFDFFIISEEVNAKKPNLSIFNEAEKKIKEKKVVFIGNNPELDLLPLIDQSELSREWFPVFLKSDSKMLVQYKFNGDLYLKSFQEDNLEELINDLNHS